MDCGAGQRAGRQPATDALAASTAALRAGMPGRSPGHGDVRIVAPMPGGPPAPPAPVTTVAEAIACMETIGAGLPAGDGLACFNRMYLQVTQTVGTDLGQGFFADPAFMTTLDVTFANLYFAAAQAMPTAVPTAWRPLVELRGAAGIEPIQFALAGMNAHINHDLPLAVVATCAALNSAPTDDSHYGDYQKVDALLDAAEQAARESFEPPDVKDVDEHVARVLDLVCNWSINSARDVAWDTALALWEIRDHRVATDLFTGALARTVAMASRVLLVAV
jgi:Family of unknown function (DUF5995)